MPRVTSALDAEGRSGLTVVRARWNASFGSRFSATPIPITPPDIRARIGSGKTASGHSRLPSQPIPAHSSITSGGGIRVSSHVIAVPA